MRITIAGCGALGSLFAARLGALGHAVQVLQRAGVQHDRLQAAGVEILELDGQVTRAPLAGIATRGSLLEPAELVIVLVKSYATQALEELPATLAPDGLLLTLQNGLGNAEWLAQEVGAARLLAGTTTSGAYRDADGRVHWGGDGKTTLGPWTPTRPEPPWLIPPLQAAGLDAHWVPDPRPALWQKLALNVMTNPLTALLGQPNGALAEHAPLDALMRRLADETVRAAARSDVTLQPDALWTAQCDNLAATSRNRSSMLQDVLAGRPTEINAILGPLLDAAPGDDPTRRAAAAPVAAALLTLVQALGTDA